MIAVTGALRIFGALLPLRAVGELVLALPATCTQTIRAGCMLAEVGPIFIRS